MLKIKEVDVVMDEKLTTEIKSLETAGRKKRDEEIAKVRKEMEKFRSPLESARFTGDIPEFYRILAEKNRLDGKIGLITDGWFDQYGKCRQERDKIREPYFSSMILELEMELKRLLKGFRYEIQEKVIDIIREDDFIKITHNGDSIDKEAEKLQSLKLKLMSHAPDHSLREVVTEFKTLLENIPESFPLDTKWVGYGKEFFVIRERYEATTDRVLGSKTATYTKFGALLGPRDMI